MATRKRAAEVPGAAAARNVRVKCDMTTVMQEEATVRQELAKLFCTDLDDVGFDELQHALHCSGNGMTTGAIEAALERMEAANQVMHREGRIHLI